MFTQFGHGVYALFTKLGEFARFAYKVVTTLPPWAAVAHQMVALGLASLPIVFLASMFTGFIATWQVNYIAGDFGGITLLGMMVMKVVFSELGPTLIGLVLAGRIGAKVAAEIGSMRVTEQIDAYTTLSLNPIRYIVVPRVWAAILTMPMLFIYGALTAIVSSQMLAWLVFDLPIAQFYSSMQTGFTSHQILVGFVKSSSFSVVIIFTSTFYGYYTQGGAVGVGRATRSAVVVATILILMLNFFLSQVMF